MNDAAIRVESLSKRYGDRWAVDGLSFSVEPGELLALLGPNGAGKTTTVEILEGYRRPDSGTVRVLGLDPQRDGARLKERIGLMLQQGGVYPQAYPLETVRLFASFFADPLDPLDLLRQVGLEDAFRTRFRYLSGGQKQRLSLALALIGRPELVFLDEPTSTMDPEARRSTWDLILSMKAQGITVLLTTHFMDEAERLADRVAILNQGRLVALGSPRALMEAGPKIQTVHFSTRPAIAPISLAQRPELREESLGRYVAAVEATPEWIAKLSSWLGEQEVLLTELRLGHRSLEDVFLSLTGQELGD